MQSRYQLIYPYTSDKIYQSNSINKVTNKIYKELKTQSGGSSQINKFVILNIDTKEFYTYEMGQKTSLNNKIQGGGNNPVINNSISQQPQAQPQAQPQLSTQVSIENMQLNDRVAILEKNITSINKKLDNYTELFNNLVKDYETNQKESHIMPKLSETQNKESKDVKENNTEVKETKEEIKPNMCIIQ